VIPGRVVMTDFARAQILDWLLVYERRIESSPYRTMTELRKERQARMTAAASEEVSRLKCEVSSGEEVSRAESQVSGDNSDFTLQTSCLGTQFNWDFSAFV
jgi:hypothetical protein